MAEGAEGGGAVAPQENAEGDGNGGNGGNGGSPMMKTVMQMMLVWTIVNVVTRKMKPDSTAAAGARGGPSSGDDNVQVRPGAMRNLFSTTEECELFVHLASGPNTSEPLPLQLFTSNGSLIVAERGLELLWHTKVLYHSKDTADSINVTIGPLASSVLEPDMNIVDAPFLHATLVRTSQLEDLHNGILPKAQVIQQMLPLIAKLRQLDAEAGAESLLGGVDDAPPPPVNKSSVRLPHLKTKLEVRPVYDHTQHSMQSLRTGPFSKLRAYPKQDFYQPYLYLSDFWSLEKDYIPLNDTLEGQQLNISLTYDMISLWAFSLQTQMTEQWSAQGEWGISDTQRDSFMLKRLVIDTNPYFLGFSAFFMISHTLCSMLAFKEDIQFWKKNESMQGLSARSMCVGFVCQLITGLYLLDSRETSRLILFEIFVDLALGFWKLKKAIKIEFKSSYPFVNIGGQKDYANSKTAEYDQTAITYMSYLLLPCFIGYTVYSLMYNKHRGWWSFTIGTLAGGVYMFGFIMMTPQLYINYKMQSVEHLPWRAMTYKAMNTFIDDIFAFLIDMPIMHRMSCFRDDIIFFIYLYQRWIYRVDKTRPSMYVRDADREAALKEENKAVEDNVQTPDSGSNCKGAVEASDAASESEPGSETVVGEDASVIKTDDGGEGLRQRR